MRKFAFVLLLLLGVLALILLSSRQKPAPLNNLEGESPSSSSTHIHASFLIFTNGTKRDFAQEKYYEADPGAHIHASNPEIIHIHAPGVSWQEFFDLLPSPMKLTSSCLTTGLGQRFCTAGSAALNFYLNGQKTRDVLRREIQDGDMLLISYGVEEADEVREQLSQLTNPSEVPLNPNE